MERRTPRRAGRQDREVLAAARYQGRRLAAIAELIASGVRESRSRHRPWLVLALVGTLATLRLHLSPAPAQGAARSPARRVP